MESQTYKEEKDLKENKIPFPWKNKEKEYDAVLKERITNAKTQRRQSCRRFDDLTFDQDYVANEDAINAYLRPKKNDDEVRINTGLTEKKIETVVNELLSYNFQHEVHAFDKQDLEIEQLGDDFGDLVTRTNEMENDEDIKCDALFELIGQRACYIEEYLEEKVVGGEIVKQCKKRVLSGLQVFLGDITIPHYRFNEQPFIVKYFKLNFWTAKSLYGHLPNFKYVHPGENVNNDWYGGEFNWRLARLDGMDVEMVVYESAPNREFQWWLNGVPMEKFGTKLPWEHDGYNTVMGITKRMASNLAYGRPQTASLKYLQGFKDDTIRNLIRKFRQAVSPPKSVVGTGKVYSKDIFEAGKVTYGVPAQAFTNLIDHQGITTADTEMLNIIERIANEFSTQANSDGGSGGKKQTATAIIEQRKQAVKMLGLVVMSWTRMIKALTLLRIENLVENFTEPEGKAIDQVNKLVTDVYNKFTLKNAVLSNEKSGTKMIQFSDRNLTNDEEDQLLEYEQKQEANGKPTQIKFINAKVLREIPITWFVTVTPKEKEDSALHRLMFADKFKQASEISQIIQKPLNPDKWAAEYEQTWKVKDAFAKPQPQQPPMPGQPGQPGEASGMGDLGAQATKGLEASVKKPSVVAAARA